MFSIARSRLNILAQFAFLLLNALGLLFGAVYNSSTPDLYVNNAHHRLGWLLICITCAQTCMALIRAYTARPQNAPCVDERAAFITISTHAMEEHRRIHNIGGGQEYRFSNDSGQGTERNTESLRSHSTSSDDEVDENRVSNIDLGYHAENDIAEKRGILPNNALDRFFMKRLPSLLPSRTLRVLELVYEIINRVILILGFMGLTTGIVTYGGIFVSYAHQRTSSILLKVLQRGGQIFSGLAHFIKGGIFFWYGIFTLGRWAGCFADLGWVNRIPLVDQTHLN